MEVDKKTLNQYSTAQLVSIIVFVAIGLLIFFQIDINDLGKSVLGALTAATVATLLSLLIPGIIFQNKIGGRKIMVKSIINGFFGLLGGMFVGITLDSFLNTLTFYRSTPLIPTVIAVSCLILASRWSIIKSTS